MKKSALDTWTIINVIVLVLCTIDLLSEIFWLRHIHTVTVVLEIVTIFCFYLNYQACQRQRRGDNIDVVEDLLNDGERTIRASEFWVGSWWTPLFLSLSATVKADGKVQWVILLRENHSIIKEIGDDAELLFKNAAGELMEIHNCASWKTRTEYEDLFSFKKVRKGLYPINLEILDALCSEDIVKIRVINESNPWDMNVKGQNLANLFRISRGVIEKALAPDNTIYSGM